MPLSDRRRGGLGLWLLLYQVFGNIGFHRIPPATLIITILQCLLFIRVIKVPWVGIRDICISADNVWAKQEYLRLFIGAFEHMDDWHLYYNMVSFIWKGITLEQMFGSGKFFYLVSIFTLLCNITLVALCKLASEYIDAYYYYQCAVGFSGVVFALKVLTTHYWPQGNGQLMGLPIDIPARYIVWAELLLIQVLVPNASFVGHLAGILVGLAYIHTPLKDMLDNVWSVLARILFATPHVPQNRFHAAFGNAAYVPTQPSGHQDNPIYGNTYYENLPYPTSQENHQFPQPDYSTEPLLTEEEQLQRAIDESLRDRYPPYREQPFHRPSFPYPDGNTPRLPLYPDLDELRRRRVDNYYS